MGASHASISRPEYSAMVDGVMRRGSFLPIFLIAISFVVLIIFTMQTEGTPEVSLQDQGVGRRSGKGSDRGITFGRLSDLEDEAELLGTLTLGSNNACIADVSTSNNALAAKLRYKDASYKVALKRLKFEKRNEHSKYLHKKEALNAQVVHSTEICRKKLTVKLEKSDSQYVTGYAHLLKQPGMLKSKVALAKSKQRLIKVYHKAIKREPKKAPKILDRFRKLLADVEKASPFARAATKLRNNSS